jgi:hypothetical protein
MQKSNLCLPNDETALAEIPDMIYVGRGGNIRMKGKNDYNDILWENIPSGTFINFNPVQIYERDTTAADIVLLYTTTMDRLPSLSEYSFFSAIVL